MSVACHRHVGGLLGAVPGAHCPTARIDVGIDFRNQGNGRLPRSQRSPVRSEDSFRRAVRPGPLLAHRVQPSVERQVRPGGLSQRRPHLPELVFDVAEQGARRVGEAGLPPLGQADGISSSCPWLRRRIDSGAGGALAHLED